MRTAKDVLSDDDVSRILLGAAQIGLTRKFFHEAPVEAVAELAVALACCQLVATRVASDKLRQYVGAAKDAGKLSLTDDGGLPRALSDKDTVPKLRAYIASLKPEVLEKKSKAEHLRVLVRTAIEAHRSSTAA